MRDMASLISIEENDFNKAWVLAMKNILSQGVKITLKDNRGTQEVLDTCQMITLSGFALQQIKDHKIHPQYPYLSTESYCKEWTREFLDSHRKNPSGHHYLAYDRLAAYPSRSVSVDQLAYMRDSLATQIDKNYVDDRCQAITWNPEVDLASEASPFIQRIWARVYPGRKVDAHFYWRATDCYNHWQSRLVCILDMFARDVLKANDCRLVRAVLNYDSLFIRTCDASTAEAVQMLPVDMRKIYR